MGAPQIAHAQKATSDVHEFLMSACQTKRAIDFEAQGGNEIRHVKSRHFGWPPPSPVIPHSQPPPPILNHMGSVEKRAPQRGSPWFKMGGARGAHPSSAPRNYECRMNDCVKPAPAQPSKEKRAITSQKIFPPCASKSIARFVWHADIKNSCTSDVAFWACARCGADFLFLPNQNAQLC